MRIPDIVGDSAEMASLLRMVGIVAVTDATVLLIGETGTGKELLAHAIHRHSPRADRPFVAVNCAALPEGLVESELFGSRRGAFTGAVADQAGKIMAADRGTLLLDEIGEVPLAAQAKLLRFLETGEVQPVGQARPCIVRARIIAATNRDLAHLVREGRFRADLYYRLNVVPVEIPPLRRRRGDVALLLEHYLGRSAAAYRIERPTLSPVALRLLTGHDWPGNVRELRNLCERLVILCQRRRIEVEDLPPEIARPPAAGGMPAGLALPDGGLILDEVERALIGQALARARGNRSQAARLLGLSRDTLLYRIKKYAIPA